MFSYSVFNLNIIRGLVKCTDGRDAVVKLTNIFGTDIPDEDKIEIIELYNILDNNTFLYQRYDNEINVLKKSPFFNQLSNKDIERYV